jgi:hypothetical protein
MKKMGSSSREKIDGFLNSLPADRERKSMLRALVRMDRPARPEEIYRQVISTTPISAEQMSDTLKNAIFDGLVDVQGEGASTTIRITSFGQKIAETI